MKYLNFGFIFLILGSIIGAGFASGKEIMVFFSGSGKFSFVTILISSIFLFFVIKNLICLGQTVKTTNIKIINEKLFKRSSKFFNFFILLGLFIFLTAMIAGLNSIGDVIFKNINFPILTILSMLFSIFIVLNGFESIKKLNLILMPIVIIFIVIVSVLAITSKSINFEFQTINFAVFLKYLMLGLFYISYNIVFASSLIFEKSKEFSKKQIVFNLLFITIIFASIIILVNLAMIKFNYDCDMPMLYLAFNFGNILGLLFSFILWFSVLTSLISSLYMIVHAVNINKLVSCCLFLTLAFIFSFFGFSKIVNIIYPLEGIICLIFIIKVFMFNKKTCEFSPKKPKKSKPKIVGFYAKQAIKRWLYQK